MKRRLSAVSRRFHNEPSDGPFSSSNITSTCVQVVYDLEDPARPRFTLAELKDILQERNSLKVGRLPVCNLDSVTLFTPDKQIKEIIISSPGYHRNKEASMGWSFSSRGFTLSPKTFCTIYSLFTKLEACI